MSEETREEPRYPITTLRLPPDVRADYVLVAETKGMGLNALLCNVLTDALPALLRWVAEHQDAREAARPPA